MKHIYGVGSPDGDDQAGWMVIDGLKKAKLGDDIILESFDRPGLKLVNAIKNLENVILIDAVNSQNTPGTVHSFSDISKIINMDLISSHGFGVGQAIELCQSLNCLPSNLIFYGIEIDNVEPLTEVSPSVKCGCQKLICELLSTL